MHRFSTKRHFGPAVEKFLDFRGGFSGKNGVENLGKTVGKCGKLCLDCGLGASGFFQKFSHSFPPVFHPLFHGFCPLSKCLVVKNYPALRKNYPALRKNYKALSFFQVLCSYPHCRLCSRMIGWLFLPKGNMMRQYRYGCYFQNSAMLSPASSYSSGSTSASSVACRLLGSSSKSSKSSGSSYSWGSSSSVRSSVLSS